MDILGQKGEEAVEKLDGLSRRLEKLETHMNAMDNALGDFQSRLESVEREDQSSGGEVSEALKGDVANNQSRIRDLEKIFRRLSKIQGKNKSRIEELEDYSGELHSILKSIRERMDVHEQRSNALEDRMDDIGDKVAELEDEFVLDVNRQDWDIDRKLDKDDFKSHSHDVNKELKKLRASVNVLADEMDKNDEIRIEEED